MTDNEKIIESAANGMPPFTSWEQLKDETSDAFSAFCIFRDIKIERNIIRAVEIVYADVKVREKKYRSWRNWAGKFKWRERAEAYDRYLEQMKQGEVRKTIEAQWEKHRQVTGKMLDVVNKKLDLMNPEDLTQGMVAEWTQTAIKADREACQFEDANCLGVPANRNPAHKQGEFNFVSDFQGL